MTALSLRGALPLVALALASCQTPLPAPNDAATSSDAAPDVDPAYAPLRYTPMGCTHTVRTEDGTAGNYRDQPMFGAMPTPTAVHVNWPADPATTAAFLWNTDQDTRASTVQYGTSRMTLDRTATGHVSTGASGAAQVTAHEVHVCGLTPDTTYYYRVGGEGHWSAVQSFKTAPAPGARDYDVNFAVSGDSRDDFRVLRAVQERMLSTLPPRGSPTSRCSPATRCSSARCRSRGRRWFEGVDAHPGADALRDGARQPRGAVGQLPHAVCAPSSGARRARRALLLVRLRARALRGDQRHALPRRLRGRPAGHAARVATRRPHGPPRAAPRSRVPCIVAVHHKAGPSARRTTSTTPTR